MICPFFAFFTSTIQQMCAFSLSIYKKKIERKEPHEQFILMWDYIECMSSLKNSRATIIIMGDGGSPLSLILIGLFYLIHFIVLWLCSVQCALQFLLICAFFNFKLLFVFMDEGTANEWRCAKYMRIRAMSTYHCVQTIWSTFNETSANTECCRIHYHLTI